MVKQAHRHTGF